jgi:hypothetical protein
MSRENRQVMSRADRSAHVRAALGQLLAPAQITPGEAQVSRPGSWAPNGDRSPRPELWVRMVG